MNNEILGWIASISTAIGATMNAFNVYPYNVYMMLFASLCYLVWGLNLKDKSTSFTLINIYLLSINALGIGSYLLK